MKIEQDDLTDVNLFSYLYTYTFQHDYIIFFIAQSNQKFYV